jgi:hypothetical protein
VSYEVHTRSVRVCRNIQIGCPWTSYYELVVLVQGRKEKNKKRKRKLCHPAFKAPSTNLGHIAHSSLKKVAAPRKCFITSKAE